MHRLYFIILLIIPTAIMSCKPKVSEHKFIQKINLENALNNSDNSLKFEIFEDISYLQLETKANTVISGYPCFFCTENYILSNAFKQIYLYDISTGSFIREIGEFGRGPNAYRATISTSPFIEKDKLIYAEEWNNVYCAYNFSGKKVTKAKLPHRYISSFGMVNDSVYSGFIHGYIGRKEKRIINFNKNGDILKIFPNHLNYGKVDKSFMYNGWEGLYYPYKGTLNFKEIYNDTLVHVKSDTLLPRFVFDMGKYSPPPGNRSELEKVITRDELGMVTWLLDDYVRTTHLCETDRYLLFEFKYKTLHYWGYFDKKTKKTEVIKNTANIQINGISFPFRLTRASVNQKEQLLISFIPAYELVSWLKEIGLKSKKLPPKLSRLKNVTENDNPVVIIAKLKD